MTTKERLELREKAIAESRATSPKTELQKAIQLIREADINCELVTYSLDDVHRLAEAIDILQEQRRQINECCY